jgi:hypothetical protein
MLVRVGGCALGVVHMSNVLIGIIGVILFIGLALAGALFLGPRFQEATNNSKASYVSTAIAQSKNAIDMYRVNEGTPLKVGAFTALLDGGYMKSRPSNVYVRGPGGETGPVDVAYVVIDSMQDASLGRDEICATFNRLTNGSTAPIPEAADAPGAMRSGCFRTNATWGTAVSGTLVYFNRS